MPLIHISLRAGKPEAYRLAIFDGLYSAMRETLDVPEGANFRYGATCGAVRYVLKGDPREIAICHCTHCQKQSGSVFSFNLVILEADYEQQGETMVYVDKGDSGQPVYRHFCGGCGSLILAKTALAPGKVVVKAGALNSMEGLQPKTEIYTDHAVKWLLPVAGATRFAQNL